jgi:putative oxidoreductase
MEKIVGPFVLLITRFWMSSIFWYSGIEKITNWEGTIALFANEYKVPHLPPELAAYMTASAELSCSVLLMLGLLGRLSTIPLLIITGVIQFTYMSSQDNMFWALLLGIILCYGPGPLSIDYLLHKYCIKDIQKNSGKLY